MPDWSDEGYQKILAAAEIGRRTISEACKKAYEEKLRQYNQTPALCRCCSSILSFEKYINKSIYCSRSCAAKVNNKKRAKTGVDAKCCNCGKEYLVKRNSFGKFCSLVCSHAHKKQLKIDGWLKGTHNPDPAALRKYLKELKPAQCEVCSLSIWNDLPIPLEVDHKDGNHKNNSWDNLQLLCPNCHAQTPTYKGKNRGKGRQYRRERWRVGKTC